MRAQSLVKPLSVLSFSILIPEEPYYLGQHNSRLEGKRLTFERFTKAIEQLAGKQGANDEDDRTIRRVHPSLALSRNTQA
jgi:hypothetical protein